MQAVCVQRSTRGAVHGACCAVEQASSKAHGHEVLKLSVRLRLAACGSRLVARKTSEEAERD